MTHNIVILTSVVKETTLQNLGFVTLGLFYIFPFLVIYCFKRRKEPLQTSQHHCNLLLHTL